MKRGSNFVYGSLAEKTNYNERFEYDNDRVIHSPSGNQSIHKSKPAKKNRIVHKNEGLYKRVGENAEIDSKAELKTALAVNREILRKEMSMRKERRRVRVKYIVMILFLFVVFAAIIYRYSIVIEINNMSVKYSAELNDIKNRANIVKKDISKETDLEKVRLLAETRLNMQKPDTHQYIYIQVPRKDHALYTADLAIHPDTEEKITVKDRIKEVIDRLWVSSFKK